jgi:hypothetical protein
MIERDRPTLLCDEVDTWLKENEIARGIINSGHTRDAAFVWRCNADTNAPEKFSTWAPKALGGIGKLADTLAGRSIFIKMERKRIGQEIQKFRDTDPNDFITLRRKLVRWTADDQETVKIAHPTISGVLGDREGDN